MSKTAHILCIAAGHGTGKFAPATGYVPLSGPIGDLKGELWIGPRQTLERMTVQKPRSYDPIALLARTAEVAMTGLHDLEAPREGVLGGLVDVARKAAGSVDPEAGQVNYPAMLQIIPYYLYRHQGRFLRYLRTTDGNEQRLHGLVSIGVGGHVDLSDVAVAQDGSIDLAGTLMGAGQRESVEEIGVDIDPKRIRWIATIYAIDTEVDRVHLGIVGLCDMTDEQVAAMDVSKELGSASFMTLGDIAAEAAADPNKTLETWTRLIIESNPLA